VSREDLQERMNELAAGYVLGNLSPEEAEILQQYVTQNPEFTTEIDQLYNILGVMPYALPEVNVPINVRHQILTTIRGTQPIAKPQTSADLRSITHPSSASPLTSSPRSPQPAKSPQSIPLSQSYRRWLGRGAAAAAIVFGLMNWHLRRDLVVTRTALIEARDQISFLEAATDAQIAENMPILQPDPTLAGLWQFERLIEDHRRATQETGLDQIPQTYKILEIVQKFQGDFEFAPTVPVLNNPGVRLISGSFCELGKIPGFRFIYQTEDGRKLSLYQVGTPDDPLLLPDANQGRLYIRQVGQPEIILWSHEGFDYALVAEMPREQLEMIGSIRYQTVSR
jgi:anti-sigma factor RsiW